MSVSTAFTECQTFQISLQKRWYCLSMHDRDYFLDLAKEHGYKDPKNAHGKSKGHCFYLALQYYQARFKTTT